MRKKYTQHDIDQFFSLYKELPDSYKLERVHQLINNPDAKAMHTVKLNHKPFKSIIMTSTIFTGAIALLCWLAPIKTANTSNQQDINQEQNMSRVSLSTIPAAKPEVDMNKNTNINQLQTDTTIDGKGFIVSLSDSELQKLGFFVDETGLYYKNYYMGKKSCFHGRWESNSGMLTHVLPYANHDNKKEGWSDFDFYPVLTSSINFTPKEFKEQDFHLMNDTLLPILIKDSQLKYQMNLSENLIIWFKVSDDLFSKLPQQYRHLQAVYEKIFALKKQYLNTNLVKYEAKSITEGLRLIELSKSELQKLGFVFKENEINYNVDLFEINLFPEGQGITMHKGNDTMQVAAETLKFSNNDSVNKTGNSQIKLIYLSNEFGEHNVQWIGPGDAREKNTFEYFQQRTQFLVPVYLRKSVYPKQLYQDQIFWFEPSMALFDAMPESIGQQLKREYIYITTGNKGTQKELSPTCIYFEACKSTFDMEEFKIYPNPAAASATIEFSIPVSSTGFISLVSISGTQLKYLVPTTTFSQGRNSFPIDVSDVPSGIYLVFISTDNGFKKQRLIINR